MNKTTASRGLQLAVRVSDKLLKALDREVEKRRRKVPGSTVNRSDVARECMHRCLKLGTANGG